MRTWEKSKKDYRRLDDRDLQQESSKKKKLKPVEKTKYRLRDIDSEEEYIGQGATKGTYRGTNCTQNDNISAHV